MSTDTTSSLPLLPLPPPPPPRTAAAPVAFKLPADCRPKVDALVHLILNIESDKCFDPDEKRQLRNSHIGDELMHVLLQCREYRANLLSSRKLVEQTSTKATQQASAESLLDFQTCLMRTSCPIPFQHYQECIASADERVLQHVRHHPGLGRFICHSQRQTIERCTGSLVSQSVRAAVEDPFEDDYL
jgi:hypothetical protein